MRALVLGAEGNLGRATVALLGSRPGWHATGLGRGDCDITDAAAVLRRIRRERPDVVILAAAYTNVDRAEAEPDECFRVNVYGAENVAHACRSSGAVLVAFSTDFVFDGNKSAPYVEEDPVRPRGVYASSKAAMENSLLRLVSDRLFLLRVGNLFGPWGRNFPSRLPALLLSRAPMRLDGERVMAPTSSLAVARQVAILLEHGAPPGIYHVACRGQATWADFARHVAARLGAPLEAPVVRTAELGLAAPRPAYSVLRNRRLEWLGLDRMPTWQRAADEFLDVLEKLHLPTPGQTPDRGA